MKLKLRPYSGAGILFWYRDAQGRVQILLGQGRSGWWSIPGGGMDRRDNGDFATCAERETVEEFGWPAEKACAVSVREFSVIRYRLPGYSWNTYLCQLSVRPDDQLFPDTSARDYHHEFLGHKWFPLAFRRLPGRLNPFMYPVLLKLALRARKH